MKRHSSIGAIRLLALISARPIRLGRTLMPMIWHRPTRPARAATTLRNSSFVTYRTTDIHLRCNFNWRTAAVHQSMTEGPNVERRHQPIFQPSKVAAKAGINRFRLQTERLWLDRMLANAAKVGSPHGRSDSPLFGEVGERPSTRRRRSRNPVLGEGTIWKRAPISTVRSPVKDSQAQPMSHGRPAGRPREFRIEMTGLSGRPRDRLPAEEKSLTPRLPSIPTLVEPAMAREKQLGLAVGSRGAGSRQYKPALIWRTPSAATHPAASEAKSFGPTPAERQDAHDLPKQATALLSVASAQPPDIGRLVDEVVRRIDRISRDERMRRGI